jgi:membrane-bound lytic murein transglycosylase A
VLEPVRGDAVPALEQAVRDERAGLLEALDRSLTWFERASSRRYFPVGPVTHERAWAGVYAFRALVSEISDPVELERRIRREFEFYRSPGRDGRGTVLFTGYYSPTFAASRAREGGYRYPLYRLPEDLVVDPASGEVKGRRREPGGRVEPYPTRAEIESSGMLRGGELVWLRDPFDAYLIQVQGSAALSLPDGSIMYVAYAGNNGHEYVSVALELVADGALSEDELSLEAVRAYFRSHPSDVERYLRRNPRFVFFREEDGSSWPLGSLGVKVTALRSLATDKALFPPGGVALVMTRVSDTSGRLRRFERFMLDQDAGGAIRSAGRADIYFGVGPDAEGRAGAQYSEGRLYYLFLKRERVAEWRARAGLGR